MIEQKDDPVQAAKSAPSRRANPSQVGASAERPESGERPTQERLEGFKSPLDKPSLESSRGKQRYLIGRRPMAGIASNAADPFFERLATMEGVEILRRLRPRALQASNGGAVAGASEIVLAETDERGGEALRQHAPPHIIVELDAPLRSFGSTVEPLGWQLSVRTLPFPRPPREVRFSILGEDDRPVAGAGVYLHGAGFPGQAISDPTGQAIVHTIDSDGAGVRAVYVRPAAGYWERYIQNPSLEPGEVNVIRLRPLGITPPKFPGERPYSWGQRMMKFDRIAPEWSGAGVRIGIIGSGCDNTHPLLHHIGQGADLTRGNDPNSWKVDELAHGTHCAGIIGGFSTTSMPVIGCAPGAELHVLKVVPGGRLSDLIDALDQCVERRVDLVLLGISSELSSELAAQKIAEVTAQGIACIAAAGDSGGPVQFPGNVRGVMTVSAIGKLGEFPLDTWHANRALAQQISFSGVFATNFSCWGPQVAICAPGVAIISSVPGGGYAAWDGSSMAAAHIAGFSALLLSHHPMLNRANFVGRPEQRVATLFELMRASAIPYALVDPARVGAGLPDLEQVPALLASTHPQTAGIVQAPGIMQAPGTVTAWPAFLGPYSDRQAPIMPGSGLIGLGTGLFPPYLPNPIALMQLRAAGVWI
jgi:subtilisin